MSLRVSKFAILGMLFGFFALAAWDYFNHTYIKAEFSKTDPMPSKMGVYYKGYKLGTTSKIRISRDFSKTYLYITLNQRGLHLPKNITIAVKNYDDDTKYVDIIYPSAPMLKYIKTGDVVKGETSLLGLDGISDTNQAHLDNLSAKGEALLTSATKTMDALTDLIGLIADVLDENRQNLYDSSTSLSAGMKNLEDTTYNLKDLTGKMNDEITRETIQKSAANLEIITSNFADSSKDFTSIAGNFNRSSADFSALVPQLRTLIEIAQSVMCNVDDIVRGFKKTLMQHFGTMRVFFGKPVKIDCR